mgnify:CR=1 FL=1
MGQQQIIKKKLNDTNSLNYFENFNLIDPNIVFFLWIMIHHHQGHNVMMMMVKMMVYLVVVVINK